jgi:hypothetical protein
MGQGQWKVDDAVRDALNAIDTELDADLKAGDGREFVRHLAAMHDLVCSRGLPVEIEELVPSDAVVPPRDISMEELRELIAEEGLIPG